MVFRNANIFDKNPYQPMKIKTSNKFDIDQVLNY